MNVTDTKEGRPVDSGAALTTSTHTNSTVRATVGEVFTEFAAGTRDYLPGVLGDIWRHGYATAADKLMPRIADANREADYWYFAAKNPAAVQEETKRTLALMQSAQGREADKRRRAALDRVQAAEPLEYRRISWLGLTDRAAYADALTPWMETGL